MFTLSQRFESPSTFLMTAGTVNQCHQPSEQDLNDDDSQLKLLDGFRHKGGIHDDPAADSREMDRPGALRTA